MRKPGRWAAIHRAGILLLVFLAALTAACNNEDIASLPEASQKHVLLVGQDGVAPLADVRGYLLGLKPIYIDTFDHTAGTPTLAQLEPYDAVFVFTDSGTADPVLLGDTLADYVDVGGKVAIASFGLSAQGSLLGRILTSAYTPLAPVSNFYAFDTMGTILDPGHPIMAGVTALGGQYRDNTTPNPGAQVLATWAATGTPVVAVNATGNVVGVSLYPADITSNTGDYPRFFANVMAYLANR